MLYIGTSGFSYDDWIGEFYPEKTKKKEMLAYYARQFLTVEINSTYYAIPGQASFSSMAANTPDDFKFVVKAHKDMTHTEEASQSSTEAFLRAIEPLVEKGKLGCVLAQYPWSFKKNCENIERIRNLKDSLGGVPVVIEFRNAEWVGEETFGFLEDVGAGFCCVDEPQLRGLMPTVAASTSNIGYVRFHGRNAKEWWKHEEAWQRYNYLYQSEELGEWLPKISRLEEETEDTYIFFNNHYKGKSAANAKTIAQLLNSPLPNTGPEQISLF